MADDLLPDAPRPALSLADLGILPDGLRAGADGRRLFRGVAALDRAGPEEVAVFTQALDPDDLAFTRAGACIVSRDDLDRVPDGTLAIVAPDPLGAFARIAARFAAVAATNPPVRQAGIHPLASVAADLRMEADVAIGPGAVIGRNVQIGGGTTIGAHCVVADGVAIGRHCRIADHVSIAQAYVGDRVQVGSGARLGAHPTTATVFGGRLIVQDDVRVGANATLEHGLLRDTVIGEAASIGPLVAVVADALVERRGVVIRAPEMVSGAKMV